MVRISSLNGTDITRSISKACVTEKHEELYVLESLRPARTRSRARWTGFRC